MQQLSSTRVDVFSSVAFMHTSAQAAPVSVGHGDERQASGFSAAGCYAASRASSEWLGNSTAVSGAAANCSRYMPPTSSRREKTAEARGTGFLGSIGSAIIGCVSKCNDLLNTPLISSVGQTFNKFGLCGQLCHLLPDLGGYAASKAAVGIGQALGGTGSSNYHFEQEWLRGGPSAKRA